MQTVIDNCNRCNEEKPIVNKKYYLCYDCNYQRLHGESYEDKQKRQQKETFRNITTANKITPKRNNKPLKQRTDKQKEFEEKLKQEYEKFDADKISTGEWYCTGCFTNQHLSHSHILRQSWCKANGKEELCYPYSGNVVLHCLSAGNKRGCHEKWESGVIEWMIQLYDFWDNLEFIRSVSEQEYQKIYQKLVTKDLV